MNLNRHVWHRWFALRPVRHDGKTYWLKTIWRKGTFLQYYYGKYDCEWIWEYSENKPIEDIDE